MNRYIFDLDGTLTISKQSINTEHAEQLEKFIKHNHSYLVTGASYDQVVTQLGQNIVNLFDFVFACQGNRVYKNQELYHYSDWVITDIMSIWLEKELAKFPYPFAKPHILHKSGSVNISFAGKNPSLEERHRFAVWELADLERKSFCEKFNQRFPQYSCYLGGAVSVDVVRRGQDKSQVLRYFDNNDYLLFFGDKTFPLGNDYPIASEILKTERGAVYNIEQVQDTYDILLALSHAK